MILDKDRVMCVCVFLIASPLKVERSGEAAEEFVMSLSRRDLTRATAMASLYIQALRTGETLWFEVVSGSMVPTLNRGNRVRIEAVKAQDIHNGEIAAFETDQGLVIHRIV